jgi:hypothetical protein
MASLRSLRRGTHLNQPDRDLQKAPCLNAGSSAHDRTIGTKQHQEWAAYIYAECIRSIVRFVLREEGAFCQLRPHEQRSRPQEPSTELDARNVQHDNPWQGEQGGVVGEVIGAGMWVALRSK